MKRTILSIFCMGFLFACTTKQVPEQTTKVQWFTNSVFTPENLKGQVKSVEQRAYWVTEENGEFVQGALMTLKERDSLDWSDDFIVYFDSSGLVKKSEYLGDDGEAYGYFKVHVEDGKYVKLKWVKNDTVRTVSQYSHDDAGNIIHMEQKRMPEDTLINTYDFKYDENGNWIGGQWSNYLGEPGWSDILEYNDARLVIARESLNADGEKASWYKYTYDENGFNVKCDGMRSDSTVVDIVYKYTEVDEKGNWIKLVSIEDSVAVGVDVRTIEYY